MIMTLDRGIMRKSIAASVALAFGVSLSASAQFGGPPAPAYTPEPDARDLKSVLFNWPWHMGMLRGIEEHELIVTLEYRAEGTIQVNGQACAITPFEDTERVGELGTSGYRISTAYQFSGSRTQIECTLPNGQTYSNIEVVSGEYAWDEDTPGGGLVPGEGTATPMPDKVDERLIRLWASPQGAPKAALAGAGIDPLKVFRNPGGLLEEGTSTIGDTSVTWDGDTPVVTFPIPGVDGATAVARLDDRFMTESVVVTHGDDTYEFTYGDYDDYNNPLNLIEVYMAGSITESKNGEVLRELNTVQTETGSVYVVVPVPPNVGPTEPLPHVWQRSGTAGSRFRRRDAASGRRQTGPDRHLERTQQVLHLALWQPSLRADPARGLQPAVESDGRFRVRGGFAFRSESPDLQAGALGRGHLSRYVDESRRSDHDLSADGDSAARRARAHLPYRGGHHPALWPRRRWRRRLSGLPRDRDRRPRAGRAADHPDQVHGPFGRPLGRRHARDRIGRLHAADVARARRLLSLRGHEGHRTLHAAGRSDALRGHGRGSRAPPALGDDPGSADDRR
jgi:hypothetical protein